MKGRLTMNRVKLIGLLATTLALGSAGCFAQPAPDGDEEQAESLETPRLIAVDQPEQGEFTAPHALYVRSGETTPGEENSGPFPDPWRRLGPFPDPWSPDRTSSPPPDGSSSGSSGSSGSGGTGTGTGSGNNKP